MKHRDLIKIIKEEKAPVSGMMYALYKDKVVYHPYCLTKIDWDGDERRIILTEKPDLAENLLELHLFDTQYEYRMVIRRGLNPVSKLIDDSCMEKEKGEFAYIEGQIQTLDIDYTGNCTGDKGQVNIVNYITYDEDDLLHIENYRLMEVR